MKYILILIISSAALASCGSKSNQAVAAKVPVQDTLPKKIRYYEFDPEELKNIRIKGFSVETADALGAYKIVSGYYEPVDGKIVAPDNGKDWGNRLLVLDKHSEIVYRSKGTGDTYLYEPHFYRNDYNGKIVIICQLAFEYYFGGDVFEFENGSMKYIGNLNIEVYDPDMEQNLTGNIFIRETAGDVFFTFNADSLILDPGGEKEKIVKNDSIRYVFERKTSKLYKNRY